MQVLMRWPCGWAHNLADGRVEVLACGKSDAVNQLCLWLHQGPPAAHVVEIKCQVDTSSNIPKDFGIS